MYFCSECGQPQSFTPCKCGKPLEHEIDTPVPASEEMAVLIQQETKRLKLIKGKEFHGVISIRWGTGYAIIDADVFAKMPQSQINKLTGGKIHEKRKNIPHR